VFEKPEPRAATSTADSCSAVPASFVTLWQAWELCWVWRKDMTLSKNIPSVKYSSDYDRIFLRPWHFSLPTHELLSTFKLTERKLWESVTWLGSYSNYNNIGYCFNIMCIISSTVVNHIEGITFTTTSFNSFNPFSPFAGVLRKKTQQENAIQCWKRHLFPNNPTLERGLLWHTHTDSLWLISMPVDIKAALFDLF